MEFAPLMSDITSTSAPSFSGWTPEKWADLERELLREDRASVAVIRDRLRWKWHEPLTRGMIIGKYHRMGAAKPVEPYRPPPDILPDAGHCHWPMGHPSDPGFHYCGNKVSRAPYCDEHRARAYVPEKRIKITGEMEFDRV
jgi:GcrA cell cycle regulator